jgi:hypothetical protein
VDGLALRIQDRCLQRDIDMRLHFRDYSGTGGTPVRVDLRSAFPPTQDPPPKEKQEKW